MNDKARRIALEIVSEVVDNGAYLNLSVKKHLPMLKEPENRRFAAALAATTIQNLFRIDYIIQEYVHSKRVHKVIRNILRIGICQLMFFESVPVSAAVNESVKLAEMCGKTQLKGFVNGVLRKIADSLGSIVYPEIQNEPALYLSLFYSYPKWLCEKYIGEYGVSFTQEMLSYSADTTLTCIRLNLNLFTAEENKWAESLLPGKYFSDARYLKSASAIDEMPLYKKGWITPQSEASMLCVHAADLKQDDLVLDICAAPGGKTAYAAGLCKEITAVDLHEHRVQLMDHYLERMSVANVKTMVWDGTVFNPEWEGKFDVVMIDAPCSALGLLYRKPDIKIHKTEEDIKSIIETQQALMENCGRYVRRGGKLLYTTCTINLDENQKIAACFLKNNPDFSTDDLSESLPAALRERTQEGMLQLFPHLDATDGFFVARMRRN